MCGGVQGGDELCFPLMQETGNAQSKWASEVFLGQIEELLQRARVLAVLPEDLIWFSAPTLNPLKTTSNSRSRGFYTFLWFP